MDLDGDRPRSVVAYDLACRLIYHTTAVDLTVSPVRSAQMRLDILLRARRLTTAEHQGLSALLRTVDGCDVDQCHAKDELVVELTRQISAQKRDFPDAKLKELATLV